MKGKVLYRRGIPCRCSAWFDNLREAKYYDNKIDSGDIYYLPLHGDEFDLHFRQNGIGYVLKETNNGLWVSLSSRIGKLPRFLVERID
jgi:hypothetical protein